ncbi:MAG: hypothetical protein QG594_535, partial [Bacteroidota bacterium]|nr:hypothetical protein [Bacteroidota bacterium]
VDLTSYCQKLKKENRHIEKPLQKKVVESGRKRTEKKLLS